MFSHVFQALEALLRRRRCHGVLLVSIIFVQTLVVSSSSIDGKEWMALAFTALRPRLQPRSRVCHCRYHRGEAVESRGVEVVDARARRRELLGLHLLHRIALTLPATSIAGCHLPLLSISEPLHRSGTHFSQTLVVEDATPA